MITNIRAVISYPFRLLGFIFFIIALIFGVIGSIIKVGLTGTSDRLSVMVDTLEALKDIK